MVLIFYKWTRHVARINILIGNPKGKIPLVISVLRYEANIKMYFSEIW
jgi:hypothetical protein